MNDGVSLTAIGDLNWSVIQAIPTIPTILTSVPTRVRHCVNPAKDQEMAPNKRVQGPLWPFPYLIPRALKCLCHFNYNNFSVKQNFLIQRTTNLFYLTSQLFLFFCIIKKDREYWPFLEKSGPQEWVVGTTLALKQNFLSGTLSHPLRDANLSSGDRKSGDFLFFTTPHPWLSTRNPSSPNALTQPKWEWLRTLYEVLHEFHVYYQNSQSSF